jgi:hypothetical protein
MKLTTPHRASGRGPVQRRRFARRTPLLVAAVGVAVIFPASWAAAAQAPIGLGTAGGFAVLAGSGITNTGATTITGNVGTFPTPSETGFGSVTLAGANHVGDAVTQQAKTDLTTAYGTAAGAGPATAVPTELGGRTLTPGVYGGPTLAVTGTLTLDTLGNPDAVFVFQASSTLITASNSAVTVLNGATACNVFWQVGSSATLGTGSHLIGSVLALTSITATTGATVDGRLLARNGAVTLDHNTITAETCAATTTATTAPVAGGSGAGRVAGGATGTGTSATGTGTSATVSGGPATVLGTGTALPGSIPPTGLAFTGFDPRLPLVLGGLLVACGALLLAASSRRRVTR